MTLYARFPLPGKPENSKDVVKLLRLRALGTAGLALPVFQISLLFRSLPSCGTLAVNRTVGSGNSRPRLSETHLGLLRTLLLNAGIPD